MGDISFFISKRGDPESIAQATSWTEKGLDVVKTTRESHKGKIDCDLAYALLLYHLGWMQMGSGEYDKGRESLKAVVTQSKAMNLKVIAKLAQDDLDKIDRLERYKYEDDNNTV